ncbi:MAG: site-specific integrase [Acidobacteria bacterium]|nr:site-specific integrase [Acidobacteriota bacterium]
MGVLVRKQDGAWWVFINHRGQRKAKKVGDKEAAKEVARKIQAALAAGAFQLDKPEAPLFKDYAQAWLKQYPEVAGIKEATQEGYANAVRLYLLPAFSASPLTAITRAGVKELVGRLRESGSVLHPGRGLCQGSVKYILAVLGLILGEAVDDGLLPSNPAAKLGKWNRRHTEQDAEGADPFTSEELEKIIAAVREHAPPLWPLVGLWAQSGMRAGEVFGLQWKDLDLEAGTAIVRRTLSQGRLGSPKTGRSRLVRITHPLLKEPKSVVEALRGLRSTREAEAAVEGRALEPEGFVFLWHNGRPGEHRAFLKAWVRCLRLAGVRYRFPEQLRHTFASTLLSRGWPLLYVQEQGGWKNATTLLQRYSRWIPREAPAMLQPAASPAQVNG